MTWQNYFRSHFYLMLEIARETPIVGLYYRFLHKVVILVTGR